MAENSVDSYIAAQPETVMSKDEFWQDYKKDFYTGSVKGAKHYGDADYEFAKFFGSPAEKGFESAYEAYLNNINNINEFNATQSARAWDKMMDDTKIQRSLKDYEKAGLNPYLLVNSGSIGGGSAPTSAKADYKASQSKKDKTDRGRNFALLMLAVARIAAAFL